MSPYGPISIEVLVEPSFQENALLVREAAGRACWLIDPGFPSQAQQMLDAVGEHDLTPAAILLTHCHVDHISGIGALREQLPDLPLWAPRDEVALLSDPVANLSAPFGAPVTVPAPQRELVPGETLELGDSSWQVLDVGGHSPGGLAFYCAAAGVAIVGDALFAGGIGRTDFPGSSAERLLGNIRANLLSLPEDTIVFSGHGPTTTVGQERKFNPFLAMGAHG
jgi:glyoxylase-like metal-dependent hydrolase (beta-lactamase superfamily II)